MTTYKDTFEIISHIDPTLPREEWTQEMNAHLDQISLYPREKLRLSGKPVSTLTLKEIGDIFATQFTYSDDEDTSEENDT